MGTLILALIVGQMLALMDDDHPSLCPALIISEIPFSVLKLCLVFEHSVITDTGMLTTCTHLTSGQQ